MGPSNFYRHQRSQIEIIGEWVPSPKELKGDVCLNNRMKMCSLTPDSATYFTLTVEQDIMSNTMKSVSSPWRQVNTEQSPPEKWLRPMNTQSVSFRISLKSPMAGLVRWLIGWITGQRCLYKSLITGIKLLRTTTEEDPFLTIVLWPLHVCHKHTHAHTHTRAHTHTL